MSKYETLDQLILERIGATPAPGLLTPATPVPFFLISANPAISAEGERLAQIEKAEARHGKSSAPGWRIIDRRLQALRKAEKIRSTSKGWVLVGGAA
ncbi:hypothetical protein KDX16_15565 [Burkholderia vietnamiensis]|jgi:hypothetical protein|uniref:Uncharacterized protein n=2 Tax=Burkholderia cepacia complex TaxID=87882 RepID=A0A228HL61_9BURK|nr:MULTISPECIES: hypothetical protein [Burkholderia]HDR9761502.1 hypothetical protein [Burkholderia cepacia ATCC 25416]MBR7917241.1 hypothetical protein [Burkholderia vietnamiensis]MBR8054755.1 hypothetical protein [Burkholderia vietnamiensis]MDN7570575.1 hypothetical protein [Burkholderia contaminans]OXI30943.1 hypothetical protein CFB84_43040 [Burkholderia aenigmatica]